jgi:hypothetical protein
LSGSRDWRFCNWSGSCGLDNLLLDNLGFDELAFIAHLEIAAATTDFNVTLQEHLHLVGELESS